MRALAVLLLVVACGHRHGAARTDDPHHLYVEVAPEGSHRGALRDGAGAALAKLSYVRAASSHGDVELQVEVARLDDAGDTTTCSVKILVVRLPQHDLLGIADGSGRARGTGGQARDDCVAGVTTSLVRGKVSGLLRRQLQMKR
ncbi:MAG TPA: hypothetical protein VIV11_32690 [Kofleriaceae bacterium]